MNKNDMQIAGSGRIASGDYGTVRISGSGTIAGSITCDEFHASGSTHADGDIKCSGTVKGSGSFRCKGNIETGQLHVSGSFHCDGGVEAEKLSCSGSCRVNKGIKAANITTSGAVSAQDMEAEKIVVNGSANVPGLMNAEQIELHPDGNCRIGSIGCGKLTVDFSRLPNRLFRAFSTLNRLNVGTIEGDDIQIENTTADIIRGGNVVVGERCNISTIEYSGTLTVDPSSEVREQIRR